MLVGGKEMRWTRRRTRRTHIGRMLAALVTLSTILAICVAFAAPTASAHEREQPVIHTVLIMAHDDGVHFSFSMPKQVPAGLVEFVFENRGTQDHMAFAFRLKPGVSQALFIQRLTPVVTSQDPKVVVTALKALLRVASAAGGANSITPGSRQDVIERLNPGHYVLVCLDSTPNGTPHFLLGMARSFFVTDDARAKVERDDALDDGAPRANGTILERDHQIVMPSVIHIQHGAHRDGVTFKVKVRDQTHELAILRVPNGTTKQELLNCLTGPPSACALKAPPVDAGGAAAIAPGSTHWVELHLAPGTYAALCFVPDIMTGLPHAFMGMVTIFTVRP